MSSKAKRSKAQREQAIHVDASADETFDTHSSSVTNATSSNSSNPHVSVRQQEKDYLQSLNDRLAGYIERVRNLETENTRLQVQINEVEIVERKEKESLATRYDVKIEELRKQLEYLTRDKAKLQIEHDKATSGYEELKSRTPQLERDLKKAEKEKFLAHDEIQNLNARLANVDSARGQLAEENDKLKTDLYSAEKQIELLRRQLEDEVLLRTELESRLVTAKEDLEFSRRSHDNQIEEMRRKRQVEMTHYGEEVQHKYETKLQEQLHAMRTDFDSRIAAQRADVEDIFHGKLQEANNQATKYREASARAREEATSLGVRLRELERSTKDHQGIVDGLNRRVKELEGMLRRAHEDAEIRLQQRDEQIAQLKLEIEQLTSDYQDLLDLKVKLDTELHAYHQMLEQEEARLHITPSGSPNTSAATSNLSAPLSTSTRKLKTDLYSAEKQIELLRRQLEDEVLLRTELESRLVTAREDLEFSRRSHDNQIEEMRRKRQVEMTHYGEEVQHKYETKLQEQLHAMRTDFDSRIAAQRADVEDIFHGKLQEANNQATKYREASARAREEATSLGVRLRELERSTKDHQGIVDGLNRRVKELEGMLRRAHEDAEIRLQQRDEQIAQLKLEIEQLTSDYQDLLDLKVKLDTELHAYHQMLEQEEARLHITPSGSPNTSAATSNLSAPLSTSTRVGLRSSPSVFNGSGGGDGFMVGSQRGTKRRRVNQEDFVSIGQSAQKWTTTGDGVGDLIIEEHDVEGKFIRLYNKGDETISVGNWVVRSTAGELETTFKFPSRAKALPGKHVTIWSSNANAEHQPPNSYVMKNQIWPHDRCIRTELLNPDREVNAWRESVLNQSFNGVQYGSDADKNCVIM
uniref:Uncharacterized protein n=3 Tax=Meloidogyne incognita group TaxID=654580 RepID=A0A914MSV8_MELIC